MADKGELTSGRRFTAKRKERKEQESEEIDFNPLLQVEDDLDNDEDADIHALNDPNIEHLGEPPLLGGRRQTRTDEFGSESSSLGRATSPKLWASASRFPSVVQHRVWRIENGIPVGLGVIDAQAHEEDFVRQFSDAMPRPGEGSYTYKLRPININGEEVNEEFTLKISEHHSAVRRIRELKRREEEDRFGMSGRSGGDVIVQGGGDGGGAAYAEEMGRMFEHAVESAEERTRLLQETLEQERERLREEERRRVEERVNTAERSATVVEKMTAKLMETDRLRAQETIASQKEHHQTILSTMTTVFSQQQEAARMMAEQQRLADRAKMEQDREFFERQRMDMERKAEQERRELEARRDAEKREMEARRELERIEWERKRQEERERLEMERQRMELQRQHEIEQMRIAAEAREKDLERRRELEREALRLERERLIQEAEERRRLDEDRRRTEREEWERKRDMEREEREAREKLAREERETKERLIREEREVRERREQERWEREKLEMSQRLERERLEWEKKEAARREEAEAVSRREKEHAERMMMLAQQEREAQREALATRERLEREAREAADRERQRQHDQAMRELELSKERDREHAERMLQLQKSQNMGGLGGITDLLGMDTVDVLSKIFGGSGESKEGWADVIPKVLGPLADVGKAMLSAPRPVTPPPGMTAEQMIAVQTPQGVRMVPASVISQMQAPRPRHIESPPRPQPVGAVQPSIPQPPETGDIIDVAPEPTLPEPEPETSSPFQEALTIDPVSRATKAGMPLLTQKKVRRSIRGLMKELQKRPKEEWEEAFMTALLKEPAGVEYVQAVSVYVALAETGIDEDFANEVVQKMQSNEVFNLIPFTEKDLEAQAQKKEEP